MKRNTKLVLIVVLLLALGGLLYYEKYQDDHSPHKLIGNNTLGTVERVVYGNNDANHSIALITGIHPREKLSISPEIKAAKEYGEEHDDVKIINYQVNVTADRDDYDKSRANGESLVHDFVNPDVTKSDADAVIISHSHIEGYGEGFYIATPEMDDASVSIAERISNTSDFGYYPKTGNESYQSTSAVLVSCPIAKAGYPTFVYEIPENITRDNSTDMAKNLFDLLVQNT